MHSPYLLIKQYLSTFHRSVKVLDSVYAGLLAHGSSHRIRLPGIVPVAAYAWTPVPHLQWRDRTGF